MNRLRRTRGASALLHFLLFLPALASAETRIATLLPCVEQALAGAPGVEIVAGVRTSFRAPERTDVVDLGSPHSPNVERLAGAGADLVVGDARINGHMAESLGRFGAEVMLIDTSSVDGVLSGLAALGDRVGAAATVAPRVAAAREQLAAQRLAEPIEVLALFGTPGRFQVVTGQAWLGSLLGELGFVNLGDDATGASRVPGFVEVSHEHLATLRPEMVVLVAHGDPRAIRRELEQKLSGPGPWAGLRESATRGVHVLSPGQFLANPGLALPDAAGTLVALAGQNGTPAPAVGAAP
ncbi:MAG: ABC transporter substrate-binding protein [Myxococcota bacterium]